MGIDRKLVKTLQEQNEKLKKENEILKRSSHLGCPMPCDCTLPDCRVMSRIKHLEKEVEKYQKSMSEMLTIFWYCANGHRHLKRGSAVVCDGGRWDNMDEVDKQLMVVAANAEEVIP